MDNDTVYDIAKEVRSAPVVEMDEDLTRVFLHMTITERQDQGTLLKSAKTSGLLDLHPYKVLTLNLETRLPTVPVSINVKAFLVCLCGSNLAKVSMMCLAIEREVKEKKLTEFNMKDLAYMFPNGFPSDETFTKIWDANKAHLYAARELKKERI